MSEYWIVDPDRRSVERFVGRDGRYPKVRPQRTGNVASERVAGFEIPVRATFDDVVNLTTLRSFLR